MEVLFEDINGKMVSDQTRFWVKPQKKRMKINVLISISSSCLSLSASSAYISVFCVKEKKNKPQSNKICSPETPQNDWIKAKKCLFSFYSWSSRISDLCYYCNDENIFPLCYNGNWIMNKYIISTCHIDVNSMTKFNISISTRICMRFNWEERSLSFMHEFEKNTTWNRGGSKEGHLYLKNKGIFGERRSLTGQIRQS